MANYERITYVLDGRSRTVILRDLTEGAVLLRGTEVDRDGNDIEPSAAFLRERDAVTGSRMSVIEKSLITKREQLEMDLRYGNLVPLGTACIGVERQGGA